MTGPTIASTGAEALIAEAEQWASEIGSMGGRNLVYRLANALAASEARTSNLQRQIDEACCVSECAANPIELRNAAMEGAHWKDRAEKAEAVRATAHRET